jgi:hypothetical protein
MPVSKQNNVVSIAEKRSRKYGQQQNKLALALKYSQKKSVLYGEIIKVKNLLEKFVSCVQP